LKHTIHAVHIHAAPSAPDKSCYVGCSDGGREAMMVLQRFPDFFDGVLA
jgi:hypothetical protein